MKFVCTVNRRNGEGRCKLPVGNTVQLDDFFFSFLYIYCIYISKISCILFSIVKKHPTSFKQRALII